MAIKGIKLVLTERFLRKQQSEKVEFHLLNWNYLDHISPAKVPAS
jgi:hypothetical protein